MTEVEIRAGDKWADTTINPDIVRNDKEFDESKEHDGYTYYHDQEGRLIYRIKQDIKIAIFPTISNPPTFGIVQTLLKIAERYDKMVVLVYNKPGILLTKDVIAGLGYVLCQLSDKFIVMSTDTDFANLNYIPKLAEGKDIVTSSTTIYANLAGKGYKNITLVEPTMGYNESFHRIAYSRSLILERLKRNIGR